MTIFRPEKSNQEALRRRRRDIYASAVRSPRYTKYIPEVYYEAHLLCDA